MDFVQITSSPSFSSPQLFLNAKNVDLSDIKNDSISKILLKYRHNTCFVGHVYNLKKQFKVQIIGILEEIDSFYWPKMHLWKGAKKIG